MDYDEWGRPYNPGRYRPRAEPEFQRVRQEIYQDASGQFYTPEASNTRPYRPGPAPAGMRPAQIIINNENNIIEDHPPPPPVEFINRRPQIIQQQQPQRIYMQEPQIIQQAPQIIQQQPQIIQQAAPIIQQMPPQVIQQAPRVYLQEQQVMQVAAGRRRSPSDLSYETRRALEDLEKLKREKDEEDLVNRVKLDLKAKDAKKRAEELQQIEDNKAMKKEAIKEWKAEQAKIELEKLEKEKEKEKIGQDYMRQQLRKEGWTDDEIEAAMNKQDKPKHSVPSVASTSMVVSNHVARRATFVKVHRKHISPETLEAYKLEWEWDLDDEDYIIIYKSLTEADQDILFEHTRKNHEKKLIKFAEVEIPVVKKIDRDRHGRLVVVRKKERDRSKSPGVKKTFFLG